MTPIKTFLILIPIMLVTACNAQTNILGRTVPDAHKDTFHNNLDMAQALYDQGKLAEARVYAKRAFDMDQDSETASVVLGYVDLSLAGGDPFALAKALIAADKEKKATKDGQDSVADTATTVEPVESNSSDTLNSVKMAIGISQEELEQLATKDLADPDYPVLIPKCVEDVRISVARLEYVDEAIRAICPFVDEGIRNLADVRQLCETTKESRTSEAKAHFLWAFSHLTEALAFNGVLSYQNPDSKSEKSNLEMRVQKIQDVDASSPEGIASLLASMKSLESTVNAILPVGGVCSEGAPTSQLRATLNDMLAVDAGFGRIVGMPENITASIRKSMAKINSEGSGSAGSKLAAMKSDFTKKISGGLSDKIDQLSADSEHPIPAAQKDQICSILGSIAGGGSSSEACNN